MLYTAKHRVRIVSRVSHMPSCRIYRFIRVRLQLPCRVRRVVSQHRVSRVSHVSRVSRHGKPSGINLMQKQSGRTWCVASGHIIVSAMRAVSAVSGQNTMSSMSCRSCLVHTPVHRVVLWREVRFRPVSCRTVACLEASRVLPMLHW